jgi:hypothetical protein
MRSLLTVVALACALFAGTFQKSAAPDTKTHTQTEYGRYQEAVIRANDLAGRIHSEGDASAFISEIVFLFPKELDPAWANAGVLHRLSHAEYESVSNPARAIPEQQVADVWNRYVREIGAPSEAIVTPVEIHNMRDGRFTSAQAAWTRGTPTRWDMPNMYAVGSDCKVAGACRAVEVLLVLNDLYGQLSLTAARERIRKGIMPSEAAKSQHSVSLPGIYVGTSPLARARQHYVQEHGSKAYDQLVMRLFDELFPPNEERTAGVGNLGRDWGR